MYTFLSLFLTWDYFKSKSDQHIRMVYFHFTVQSEDMTNCVLYLYNYFLLFLSAVGEEDE